MRNRLQVFAWWTSAKDNRKQILEMQNVQPHVSGTLQQTPTNRTVIGRTATGQFETVKTREAKREVTLSPMGLL
jgi:hypothetical protein